MSFFRRLMPWALLICAMPIILAFASTAIAGAFGCNLNEGGGNACIVAGVDIGGALSTMFIMHWFGLTTLPIAALLILIWLVAEFVNLFRRKA